MLLNHNSKNGCGRSFQLNLTIKNNNLWDSAYIYIWLTPAAASDVVASNGRVSEFVQLFVFRQLQWCNRNDDKMNTSIKSVLRLTGATNANVSVMIYTGALLAPEHPSVVAVKKMELHLQAANVSTCHNMLSPRRHCCCYLQHFARHCVLSSHLPSPTIIVITWPVTIPCRVPWFLFVLRLILLHIFLLALLLYIHTYGCTSNAF